MDTIHTNESTIQTIFESDDTIKDLKDIEKLSKNISNQSVKEGTNNRVLIRLLRISEDQMSIEAPLYATNPYVEAFFFSKNQVLSPLLLEYDLKRIFIGDLEKNSTYQDFKRYLVEYTSTPEFKQKVRLNRKSERKREVSAENYIEAFRQKYARLTVVRVDLYLTLDTDRINYTRNLLRDMMYFWSHLRRDLNECKAIPNPEGFIASIEHGHIRGFHFHLMLLFDGSKHQRDIYIAKTIGEHWKHKITNGRGAYHNCNATGPGGYKYYGIGRLDYCDELKFNILKYTAYYLTKTDSSLQAVIGNQRTFFRGIMPKQKSGRGRVRKKFMND